MNFDNICISNFEGAFKGMRNPLASWNKSDSAFGLRYLKEDLANEEFREIVKDWVAYDGYEPEDQEHYIKVENWLAENGYLKLNPIQQIANIAYIGPYDMELAQRLCKAGPEHRKFLRQIQVCVDITAPLYWWKEFDTYKIGTTANSTSTMHKLASTPITWRCFELDDYEGDLQVGMWSMDSGEGYMPEPDYENLPPSGKISAYEDDKLISEVKTEYKDISPDKFILDDDISAILNLLERLRQKYNETKDKRYWKELVRWLPNGWLQTRTVTMNYENLRSICAQRANHKLTEWHSFVKWTHSLPYADQLIFDEEVAF